MKITRKQLRKIIREAAQQPDGNLDEFLGAALKGAAALGGRVGGYAAKVPGVTKAMNFAKARPMTTAALASVGGYLAAPDQATPEQLDAIRATQENLQVMSQAVHDWDGTPEQAMAIVQGMQEQLPRS